MGLDIVCLIISIYLSLEEKSIIMNTVIRLKGMIFRMICGKEFALEWIRVGSCRMCIISA